MTKNEVMNDMKFRRNCCDFGLDWMNFEIYKNIIVVHSDKKGIHVLFDEFYNVIGILDSTKNQLNIDEIINMDDKLPYPFENINLSQLILLSDRILIEKTNNGHSSDMIVNGELIVRDNNVTYIELLSYIKFLGEEVKEHFKNEYQMKLLGYEYPNVYSYLKRLVLNINESIKQSISRNTRPFPIDLIRCIGKNRDLIDIYDHALYNVINLLLKENNVQVKKGSYNELTPLDEKTQDLNALSVNLLKLLDVTESEVKERFEDFSVNFHLNEIDLQSWLQEKNNHSLELVKKQVAE